MFTSIVVMINIITKYTGYSKSESNNKLESYGKSE